MASKIESETSRLGYPREDRPFSPHLTLGRISQIATPEQIKQISETLAAQTVGELGTTEIHEVTLFRSDLRPTGVEYTPLLKILLRK